MSGISEMGMFPALGANSLIAPADLDRYHVIYIDTPLANVNWFGTCTSATASAPVVTVNQLPDWPRNLAYTVTGVAGGMGGTFTASGTDQFGVGFTETVAIGSAAGGGTAFGTVICAKYGTATFSPAGLGGTAVGTVGIGLGTAVGTAGNYWGLLSKIAGTSDIKLITWITTSTPTTLNGGTSIGSLVNVASHSFQGTSGVASTDHYRVTLKSTFNNLGKPKMAGL